MSSNIEMKYHCDRCGKKLPTDSNSIAIVSSNSEKSICWSRLRVTIEHHYGSHNDGKVDPADLCKPCTVKLLSNALTRVKKGERMSAGVESIDMLKFNQPF